jgi:hypothetical protein
VFQFGYSQRSRICKGLSIIKGHALPDCWTLFENKRPDDFKPTEAFAKKVKDKLAKDKNLAAEVEKIRLQEAQDALDEA